MLKVSLFDKHTFFIQCDDEATLEMLQGVTDGWKVRNRNIVKLPWKASVLLLEYTNLGIEIDQKSKSVIDHLVKTGKSRIENIKKIKSQYGSKITFDYDCKGRYQPLEHQKVMFGAMYYSNAAAVIADPGTCKTGPYLWVIDKRISKGIIKKALVITLSDLKKNVLEEMSAQTPHLKGVILDGRARSDNILNKKFKIKKKNDEYDIYIANYELMRSITDLFPDDYFDMVVLDEAHRIGFPGTEQTKRIIEKFENVSYKYIITGTLHANNLMSFFMPFRFLGADALPVANYYEFRRRYMMTVDPDQHIWVPLSGSKSVVAEITGKLSVMFKKDDCLDLPPIVYEKYTCEMTSGQEKLYNELKSDLISIIDDMCSKCNKKENCDRSCEESIIAKNALVLSTKLHQIASGFYINTRIRINQETGAEKNDSNIITLDENPKMRLLLTTLNNMPTGEKVIIWTNYTHACYLISEALKKAYGDKSYLTCFGNEDAYDKVKEFEISKSDYIVANPRKMGVGQNIQYSHYQIFFSNSRSYVVRDQAEGRQHRKGQKNKVTVIDLITEGTVDELALKCLSEKKDLNISLSKLSRVLKKPKDINILI